MAEKCCQDSKPVKIEIKHTVHDLWDSPIYVNKLIPYIIALLLFLPIPLYNIKIFLHQSIWKLIFFAIFFLWSFFKVHVTHLSG